MSFWLLYRLLIYATTVYATLRFVREIFKVTFLLYDSDSAFSGFRIRTTHSGVLAVDWSYTAVKQGLHIGCAGVH